MLRASCLAVLLAALIAAPARAALTEAPFAPAGPSAGCLRATGQPGELALLGPEGAHGAVDLWGASAGGPVRGQRIPVPFQSGCAEIASAPGGAAVLAVTTQRTIYERARLLVATREPGGRFGALTEIARPPGGDIAIAVATNAQGAAVVAWQQPSIRQMDRDRITTRAVRRTAAGGFGAPQTLDVARRDYSGEITLAAGVDGAGWMTVAWSSGVGERLVTATAPPAGAFGPRTAVPGGENAAGDVALAVAPDGRALVAAAGLDGFALAERGPGEAAFTTVPLPAGRHGAFPSHPSIAVVDGGGALLAWRTGVEPDAGVRAAWRASHGAFGTAQTLDSGRAAPDSFGLSEAELFAVGGVYDRGSSGPSVVLGPDGRAAIAWSGSRLAAAATGDLTRGLAVQRFRSGVRSPHDVVGWLTAAGDPALAWADSDSGVYGFTTGYGRLHLAFPGAMQAPRTQPPGASLRVARHPALYLAEALPVTVRCRAACDVRLTAGGNVQTDSLARAGTLRLRAGLPEQGGFRRPITVRVTVSAPGSSSVRTLRTVRRVRKRPPPPVPQVSGLRAHRTAAGIVVTWTTDVPARRVSYTALVTRGKGDAPGSGLAYGQGSGGGRRRHRLVIDAGDAPASVLARGRYVHLFTTMLDRERELPAQRVRVR